MKKISRPSASPIASNASPENGARSGCGWNCRHEGRAIAYDSYGLFVGLSYGLHVAIAGHRLLLRDHPLERIEETLRDEPRLYNRFVLFSAFELVYLADRELADEAPALPYDPRESRSKLERKQNRAEFVEQRLNPDVMLEIMLDDRGLVTQGRIQAKSPGTQLAFMREVRRLLEPFEPVETPVFWRILVTQFVLCELFIEAVPSLHAIDRLTRDLAALERRTPAEILTGVGAGVLDDALRIARQFLKASVVPRFRA